MSIGILNRLGRQLDDLRPADDRLDLYYAGKQPGHHFMAPEVRASLGNRLPPLILNWPRLVVSAVEERLDVVGFRLSRDEPADRELWRIWQANRGDEASQQAHLDALVHGCAYVGSGPAPTRAPRGSPWSRPGR